MGHVSYIGRCLSRSVWVRQQSDILHLGSSTMQASSPQLDCTGPIWEFHCDVETMRLSHACIDSGVPRLHGIVNSCSTARRESHAHPFTLALSSLARPPCHHQTEIARRCCCWHHRQSQEELLTSSEGSARFYFEA